MKRSTRILLIVAGLGGVFGVAALGRFHMANGAPAGGVPSAEAQGDRTVPIATAIVEKRDVPIILEGLGTATPLATVTVKSQVDGRLDKVLFTEGQPVKKGDVIALIDQRPFAIQLHQAQAVLTRDEATLKNNAATLERSKALKNEALASQQEVDNSVAAVGVSEATILADKTQIEGAQLLIDYSQIKSPIDGVTGVRQVDPGNLVHVADANGIVVVTQIDPMGLIFTLPQDELPRVQRAMKEGKVTVDAYARDGIQKLATGELLLIDNQVNQQTSTIRLKATMANSTQSLWPNAFAKARMHLTTIKNAVVVPAAVVQRGPNGTFAYVVDDKKTAQTRPIEVASIEGNEAVISKGLTPGETVVTDGQNQIRPGSKVAPRNDVAPPAGSSSATPEGGKRKKP